LRNSPYERIIRLESEQQKESHHQTEKTHSFGQGESQDSVREQLLFEGGVASVALDEGTENGADTSSGSGDSDGGGAGTDEFGSAVNVLLDDGGLDATGLDDRSGPGTLLGPDGGGSGPLELSDDAAGAGSSDQSGHVHFEV